MEKKIVFLTGMSGYLGTRLCLELEHLDWCERFFGMDVKKPLYKYDKGEFRQMDINSPALLIGLRSSSRTSWSIWRISWRKLITSGSCIG